MKRILASFIISIVSVSASAQYVSDAWDTFYPSERGKVDFFVRAGASWAKCPRADHGYICATGGIGMDFFLSPDFSIQSGLFYIAKGCYYIPRFIECPVVITYNSCTPAGRHWQVGFGAFVARLIGDDYSQGLYETFDYGLTLSGGIFLRDRVFLGLNCDLGLDKDYYHYSYYEEESRTISLSLVLDFHF